jgi:hypothetical protein
LADGLKKGFLLLEDGDLEILHSNKAKLPGTPISCPEDLKGKRFLLATRVEDPYNISRLSRELTTQTQ